MVLQSLKVSLLWTFPTVSLKTLERKYVFENIWCATNSTSGIQLILKTLFLRTPFLPPSENGDRLPRRNAGLKKNPSLAPFWLNWEIGIHQMLSTERKCKCFYMQHPSFSIRGLKDKTVVTRMTSTFYQCQLSSTFHQRSKIATLHCSIMKGRKIFLGCSWVGRWQYRIRSMQLSLEGKSLKKTGK